MPNNDMAEFFSNLAPRWDEWENTSEMKIDGLLSKLEIKEGDRVLDVACGTGIITLRLAKLSKRKVLGVDIAPKMIEIAKKKHASCKEVEFLEADFTSMAIKEPYDYVVIYNAYPHFVDKAALSEALNRALRPGGKFAIVHSLSRAALDRHHENMPEGLTASLSSPIEESKYYERDFSVILAEEDEEHYLLIEQRK